MSFGGGFLGHPSLAAPHTTHCVTALEHWALEFLQCTTTPPWGGWASELLQCTATMLGGTGHRKSCGALLHRLGTVGSGRPATHCHTAWGQWAVHLRSCSAILPGGSGQWKSCNALPHCLGAVGIGTPAMHCFTALGHWALELVQCIATPPGSVGIRTLTMHCHTVW